MSQTTMENVVQNACFSADDVAIGFNGTGADRTRAVVARAIEALEANGIITINDPDTWPEYYAPNPPYRSFMNREEPTS